MDRNGTPLTQSPARRDRLHRRLAHLGLVLLAGFVLTVASPSRAEQPLAAYKPVGRPAVACPLIPNSSEIDIDPDEWRRIQSGEIVVRIIRESDQVSRAQAVGYLDLHPLWLFDLATDSALAPEIVDKVRRVEIHEQGVDGKVATGQIKAARLLPTMSYTFASRYLPSSTGQCWGQISGDFSRNEGAHSFLWDPVRQKTLGVFSFTIGMKGLLGLLPERFVLQSAADMLPSFMRSLEAIQPKVAREDPGRVRRIDEAWARTRPRLEAGEFPGRVWTGYAPIPKPDLAQSTDAQGEQKETR